MGIKVNTGITPKKASTTSIEGVIGRVNTDGTVSVGTGTRDHAKIYNKDLPDQHPIIAITGLADALKQIGVTENNLELAVKDLAKHLPTDTAPAKVEVKNGVLILTLINGEVIKFAPGTSENAVKSVNGIKPDKTGNVKLNSDAILLSSSLFQDIKDDIARIEADTVKLENKINTLDNKVKGFDTRITDAEAKADEAKAKAGEALTAANAAKTATTKEAKRAKDAEAGLQSSIDDLDSQIEAISDELDAVKTKVDELPSATELESELAAKQDKIDAEHPIDIDSVSGLQDELDKIPEKYVADAIKSEDGGTLTLIIPGKDPIIFKSSTVADSSVIYAATVYDFDKIGQMNKLYVATEENNIYFWNGNNYKLASIDSREIDAGGADADAYYKRGTETRV